MPASLPRGPRKEDVLFKGDLPDWRNNACFRGADRGGAHAFAEGYRLGAGLLVTQVVEHQENQDYLIYPIVFLYRHHIELALKALIGRAPILIGRALTTEEEKHLGMHRLDLLWQDLRPMFSQICTASGWGPPIEADLEGVDNYIQQLTSLDPYSYSFRYTRSKKGDPLLPSDLKRVNVRHFATMMEQLADYFDGLGWHDPINTVVPEPA
jgi:hypothetical protein